MTDYLGKRLFDASFIDERDKRKRNRAFMLRFDDVMKILSDAAKLGHIKIDANKNTYTYTGSLS